MWPNIFKTSIRNLRRLKSYTFINVFGLALGISCSLVIFRLISYEYSFDQFHNEADRIYRIVRDAEQGDKINKSPAVPHPFGDALKKEVSGLEEVVKVHGLSKAIVSHENDKGEVLRIEEEKSIVFTRSNYFELFEQTWLAGSPEAVLDKLNAAVISRDKAKLFFGLTDENLSKALGSVLKLDDKLSITVSGVVENAPSNTDFPFGYFIHYESLNGFLGFYRDGQNWMGSSPATNCYVTLNTNTTPEDIETQLPRLIEKHKGSQMASTEEYTLQHISDIHFNPEYANYTGRTVKKSMINGLILIGVFIMLTACVNFINLSTSLALRRAKEVGIRKVLGSSRKIIITQYVSEAFIITLFAAVVSLGLAELVLINLDQILGYSIRMEVLDNPMSIGFLLGLVLLICAIAGIYPAWRLSRYRPIDAIKVRTGNGKPEGRRMRKGLVIFQFIVSQVLIISTIVIVSQLNYFKNQDLGFNHSDVLMIDVPNARALNPTLFKTELLKHPAIEKVSFGMGAPQSASNGNANWNYTPLGLEQDMVANFKSVDEAYFELFDLKIIAGRALMASDLPNQVVINEKVLDLMGLETAELAIGKKLQTSMLSEVTIVGVVENFHLLSLKEEIPSSILFKFPGYYYKTTIKVNSASDEMNMLASHIENAWSAQFPDKIFDFELLDDQLASFYAEEQRLSKVVIGFAAIAILVGCLGLYGLVSFMANQRTKEIGIRKVLGASVSKIVGVFSWEFGKLVFIAFLIAAPIGYFGMESWLQDYKYGITIGPMIFIVSIGASMLIAFVTTIYRSHKAASVNPVQSLKDE